MVQGMVKECTAVGKHTLQGMCRCCVGGDVAARNTCRHCYVVGRQAAVKASVIGMIMRACVMSFSLGAIFSLGARHFHELHLRGLVPQRKPECKEGRAGACVGAASLTPIIIIIIIFIIIFTLPAQAGLWAA